MEVLRGLESLPAPVAARGSVVTVGVFDGVHLGHFAVLRRVVERAAERGLGPAVVTFAAHPKELLTGHAPPTVTSLEHRLLLFRRIGLETALVLDFGPEIRDLPAEGFVRRILVEGLGARGLVLGFDSKFGRGREGTVKSLRPLARSLGLDLEAVGPLRLQGRALSSTAVREAVSLGELERAAAMLGRPVSLLGTVVRGDGRGRELGFPTANLDLHHELKPPPGVYAALARIRGREGLLPAAVNVGVRPTFNEGEPGVEVHLLEGGGDLYERDLEVFFLERLRGEERFPDPEALAAQIRRDVEAARAAAARAPERWRIPGRYLPIEGPGPESLEQEPA